MPLIASFFAWIAPTITAWAVAFFTRKIAVAGASIASFILLTAAFIVCIKQMILIVLALAVLPAWLTMGFGMFIPFNFSVVLSNILAAQSCRWAYDKAMDKIRLINAAS